MAKVNANSRHANNNDDFYTAAVVEFPLPTSPHEEVTNVKSMIDETLNEYLRLINEASEQGVDVLVFPEGALNYIGIATRKMLIKYAVDVSDDDIMNSTEHHNNCDYSNKSPVRNFTKRRYASLCVFKINNST
jgi:hypothetical protein